MSSLSDLVSYKVLEDEGIILLASPSCEMHA